MVPSPLDPFSDFTFGGLGLFDAIDALMAYDMGAIDSGINDDGMRRAVRFYLESLGRDRFRCACAFFARRYLSDESIADGYGVADVVGFVEWLSSLGLAVPRSRD